MIAADFDLNLGGFFEKLKVAETAVAGLKLPTLSLSVGGIQDAGGAVGNMQNAFSRAAAAATPLQSALARIEGGLHGLAAVSRIANTAIALLPNVFSGLHPAVTKTFSAVSLASRGFDVLRGKLTPLGGVMAFLELRNLGLSKSYSALAATLGVASSAVMGASRRIGAVGTSVARGLASTLTAGAMGFSSLLGPMAAVGGVAGVTAAAVGVLGKSLSSAANLEGLQAEFSVMLGSLQKAQDMTRQINDFAAATPFATAGLAGNVKTLLAFGAAGDAIMPTLKMLGDVAGSSQEKLNLLTLAFAQISAAGKLQGQDLLQLVNAGFNPLQEISRTTGESMASLRQKMSAGAISADMVAAAFKSATSEGGRFFNNTITQSKTWNGLMSTLGDNINMAFAAFGTPVMESLKPLLSGLVDYTKGLADQAAAFGQAVANVFNLITAAFGSGQIGELVALALQVGFAKAVNFLLAAFRGLVAMLMSAFTTAPSRLMDGLKALFDGNLWTGLGQVLMSIGQGFISVLSSGLAPLVDKLIGILNKIPGIEIPFSADDFATAAKDETEKNWREGMARMGSALAPVGRKFADDFALALAEFQKAFAATPGLLDEEGPASRLAVLLGNLQAAVDAGKTKDLAEQSQLDASQKESAPLAKLVSSSLAQIGLGGYVSASSANPELAEARKQTRIHERTMRAVEKLASSGGAIIKVVPTFGY